MIRNLLLALAAIVLIGCQAPVDTRMISSMPASQADFAAAQRAVSICGRTAPNWDAARAAFEQIGYAPTQDPRLRRIAVSSRSDILQNPASAVIIQLGARGRESACLVGMNGMTPDQSLRLAEPLARQFDAQTNAERGQGLANDVVQAWGSFEADRIVFVAAYKTWDVLDAPGSAIRLIHVDR